MSNDDGRYDFEVALKDENERLRGILDALLADLATLGNRMGVLLLNVDTSCIERSDKGLPSND